VKSFGTVIAFDFKGHGHSKNTKHIEDMSIETLIEETTYVLKEVMKLYTDQNIIMIGHSLGGAVCCRVTENILKEEVGHRVQGMIIIDVVEGTAMDALPFMVSILQNRPQSFGSLEEAIKWSVTSGTLKKVESAKVSIPPQLIEVKEGNISGRSNS
jgi:protein phosphatase methylesterase 1